MIVIRPHGECQLWDASSTRVATKASPSSAAEGGWREGYTFGYYSKILC
jgi:hypothetical protein